MKKLLLVSILILFIYSISYADINQTKKAADQGNAKAQYNLGVMYDKGTGVAQDYKEAIKWYQKAADQGYASAQYNLGVMYANGDGVIQSDSAAIEYFYNAGRSYLKNSNKIDALTALDRIKLFDSNHFLANKLEKIIYDSGKN